MGEARVGKDAIHCDVLVVGGGPSGIAAAIASARHRAGTVLIERFGCVGGMATTGLVGPIMTCYDARGEEQIVKGVFGELVQRMVRSGGAIDPANVKAGSEHVSFIHRAHHNATPFDPECMKYVAMEMLLEAGVDIRFHTRFVETKADGTEITGAAVCDKSGLRMAHAGVYIDTTGDGDVAASAGNPFEKGRPADNKMQPATLFLRIGGVNDREVLKWQGAHPKAGLFGSFVERARAEGNYPKGNPRVRVGLYHVGRHGEWRVNTTRILDVDGTVPESLTDAEIEGRRQAHGLMSFFRRYCPGFSKAYIMDTAAHVGIRETRRITGKYRLTASDVRQARRFDDAIARYYFFMDIHNPIGSGQAPRAKSGEIEGDYFTIPYRCLVPEYSQNLLTAGRCISVDHEAFGATRIMPACFATGQAAGTAAAMCIGDGCLPSDVPIDKLRHRLTKDGCMV